MKETKYIVYDSGLCEEMIIFGNTLQHADVARAMGVTPLSAGFLNIGIDENNEVSVRAYGESISLKLESGEHDTSIAARVLGLAPV